MAGPGPPRSDLPVGAPPPDHLWAATEAGPPSGALRLYATAAVRGDDALGAGTVAAYAVPMALAVGAGALPLILTRQHELDGRRAGCANAIAAGIFLSAVFAEVSDSRHLGPGAVLGLAAGAAAMNVLRPVLTQHVSSRPHSGFCARDGMQKAALMLLAVAVHGMGEATGVGHAFATGTAGEMSAATIAVHNVAEGLAACLILTSSGGTTAPKAVLCVLAAKAMQPAFAALAYAWPQVTALSQPYICGFAAGALAWLVVADVLPDAARGLAEPQSVAALVTAGVAGFEALRVLLEWAAVHPAAARPAIEALVWSTGAGLCTGLGAVAVAAVDEVSEAVYAGLLGCAAGVMLSLSVLDLLLPNAVNHGWQAATGCLVAGVLVVFALDRIISALRLDQYLLPTGSSGHLSDVDLSSAAENGEAIDKRADDGASSGRQRRLRRSALLTMLALAAHNAPEGLAVGLTSMSEQRSRTALIAIAMALHNIPEGLAVAVAVLRATKDKTQAVVVATCTGLVEPVAAVLSVAVLSRWMTATALEFSYMVVAGVMTTVSVKELLPQAFEKRPLIAGGGCALGFIAMGATVWAMEPDQAVRVAAALGWATAAHAKA